MKQKKALICSLVAPVVLAGCFFCAFSAKADENIGTLTVSSVDISEIDNVSSHAVTITGTGFTSSTKVALYDKNFGVVEKESNLTPLVSSFVSETEITATIPAGTLAGQYDLWVYENLIDSYYVKYNAFQVNCEVSADNAVFYVSNSKSAKAKVNVTYKGVVFSKKKWVKARANGKNIPVLKLTRSGNDSTIKLNLNYKNWKEGYYDLVLRYKNRIHQRYVKKNKFKYRSVWEIGTITSGNIFSILKQPTL